MVGTERATVRSNYILKGEVNMMIKINFTVNLRTQILNVHVTSSVYKNISKSKLIFEYVS
jgi:hypothetical protein